MKITQTPAANGIETDNIILFDGYCPFCSGLVRLLIRLDRRAVFHFAILNSETASGIKPLTGASCLKEDSVLLFSSGGLYCRSDAVFMILRLLGFPWNIPAYLRFVPRFIRDRIYDLIARNRKVLFGKYSSCMIPDENIRSRFLP